MISKIQIFVSRAVKNLQDIKVVGLLIFGIIAILVTWSGVGAIETNYTLQQQISQLKQQNTLFNLQNNNQQLQNQYYTTNEYLELQARQILAKASPGEKLILVPQSVALAQTINIPTSNNFNSIQPPAKPKYQTNFEAWINFLFHRNN